MPLTAAQIVADACTIASAPGYVAIAGRQLNLVLNDLVMHRNLKVNLVSTTISVPPNSNGPFNLETNYLRTYDLFYLVSSEPFFLNTCSLKEYDAEDQQAGLSSYPYEWASDLSPVASGNPGLLYIYPQSSQTVLMTHRYYLNQPDIVAPQGSTVVPWFSDQDYLVTATAMRIMRFTNDERYEQFQIDCERLLMKHLLTEGDEQQVVKEVQLDPRRFRISGSSRPTKLDPF
jgi:hypothetical protein